MSRYRTSFQLYSARNFPPVDDQLQTLAAIGLDAVEPYAGAYGKDPAGFRRRAAGLGLACPTAHIPIDQVLGDLSAIVATARALDLETVVIPYLTPEERPRDAAGWKALARRTGDRAKELAGVDLKLAWHNHDFEFQKLPDGSRPVDHLLAVPGYGLELDVGWLSRAGVDVVSEIPKLGGRVVAFHVKDRAPDGTVFEDGWTNLGAGIIDWKAIFPLIEKSGADLLVLEHDNPSNWKEFAARSYDYLSNLVGDR